MGILIAILVISSGLYLMSSTFRWIFLLTLICLVGYGFIHSEQFGDSFRHPESVENLVSLIYLTIGIFGLGSLLGILRKVSHSPASYASHRNTILRFLAIWGVVFIAWSLIGQKLIYAITGDHGLAYFIMKRFGGIGFITLLVIFLVIRHQLYHKR